MPIDKSKITNDILVTASKCQTADDLIALAKAEGIDLTKDEAEVYLSEMGDVELTDAELEQVAGGDVGPGCWTDAQPVRRRRGPRY